MHILYLSRVRLNPYVDLLARGVMEADPALRIQQHRTLPWLRMRLDWRWRILHIHWIELQYDYGAATHDEAARELTLLLDRLTHWRKRGRKIVYTVHNINHHEGQHADLNQRANRWIFEHADAIHVHNHFTAEQVARLYGRTEDVFVIPHGNYIGVYPQDIPRREARERLGVPQDHFVYLCLGQMRPYKGLDDLIAAFLQLEMADATLLLAGHIADPAYARTLKRLAGEHPGIRLFPGYVPPDEIQIYCHASDICVLPYRDATTSGAALLAFSFGSPIIAPALGPFPELLGANERGLLFHPRERDLGDVLAQARDLPLDAMSRNALAFARARDWRTIGAQHARIYYGLL